MPSNFPELSPLTPFLYAHDFKSCVFFIIPHFEKFKTKSIFFQIFLNIFQKNFKKVFKTFFSGYIYTTIKDI